MTETTNDSKDLQAQLADKMMGIFDGVASDQSRYYTEHPGKIPHLQDVDSIISKWAEINTYISGGIGLIPGPWGMAAAIPEIAVIIRDQIVMIYDIGMAYGKGEVLEKELLAGVFASALGTGGTTLLTMHGGKILVRRASRRVFQKIITSLAGKVTQQLLKSMISKWLPVIGAVAMAAWSNYSTRQVGKEAVEVFKKEIEYMPEEIEDVSVVDVEPAIAKAEVGYEALKIQAFINLMKVDRQIAPEEREYVQTLVDKASIGDEEKAALLGSIDTDTKFSIDYAIFANAPDEAIGLLIDLVALSKRDGTFHISEKMYIKQVGKLMGSSDSDVEEAMASG
jgi:uncharacterized protein (DUF697 family)/uncharacterized tellurite resistance protein B-like protein